MLSARLCVLVFVSAVLTKYFIFSQQNLIVSYLFILNHKNPTFVIRYKKPRIAYKDGIHNEVLFRRISKPNLAYDVHESTVKRPSDNQLFDAHGLRFLLTIYVAFLTQQQ